MNRTFLLLLSISLLSCTGKKENTTQANVATGIDEEMPAIQNEEIPETKQELLWYILMKIPENHTPYDFLSTQEQRREAKETGMYTPYSGEDDSDKDYLEFEDLPESISALLLSFPTEDEKKLIIIYQQKEYVFDVYHVVADYTYEFELATGKLTPIERPIDPYTFDEFFPESIFTPKQLRAVKYSFNNKAYHTINHSIYNKCDLQIYLNIDACFGNEYFDSEDEFRNCNNIAWEYVYEHDKGAKRYWNGRRFVKRDESEKENAPITNKPNEEIDNSAKPQEGTEQKTDEIITKKLLWEIFAKIPEEAVTEEYSLKAQRKKTLEGRHKYPPFENYKNHLIISGMEEGQILVCYPTGDKEKLVTIFHYAYGIDGANTIETDLTFEYDISTGELTPIERPVDPFTFDEFIDESFLNPKQLEAIKYAFKNGKKFIYDFTDSKDEFGVVLIPDNNSPEEFGTVFNECRDILNERGNNVKRYWNGQRFVKKR